MIFHEATLKVRRRRRRRRKLSLIVKIEGCPLNKQHVKEEEEEYGAVFTLESHSKEDPE